MTIGSSGMYVVGVALPEQGRQLAAAIPGARYVSLPSANHLLLDREPAWPMFLDELGLFLGWEAASMV